MSRIDQSQLPDRRPAATDAAILEAMGLPLMAVDERCCIIRFNGLAEELTGYPGSVVIGRPCEEVLRASLCRSTCPVREAMRTGTTCCYGTVMLLTVDQTPRTVEVTASALLDPEGRICGAVGILRDVTDDPGQVRIYGSRVFVSRTPAMRRLFDALPRLAGSRAPLLIVGGRGSGRAALAETIHTLSTTPGVGLALESVRCASPGAGGILAQALQGRGGGTILLEDIGSASTELQQTLLARIEEGDRLPFRLMSTATERLETALEQGVFRRDLFYRLNVLHVALPSLADRTDDIPLLAAQFVEDLNARDQKEVRGLTPRAMARLQEVEWPGNVRQLRMVVEDAHARCHQPLIDLRHLPELASRRKP